MQTDYSPRRPARKLHAFKGGDQRGNLCAAEPGHHSALCFPALLQILSGHVNTDER